MKPTFLIAVVLALNTISCTSTDPATGKASLDPALTSQSIDDVVTAAEFLAVVLYPKGGANYDNLIVRAEQMRQLNDLPAAKRLLASLSGRTVASTQPIK